MQRESLLETESYLELARTAAVQTGSWKALSQKEKIKNGLKKYLLHPQPAPFFGPQGLLALRLKQLSIFFRFQWMQGRAFHITAAMHSLV